MYDEGRYQARTTKQALGETKTGKPQFVLTFSLNGMIDPVKPDGDLIACAVGERLIYRVITSNTIDFLVEDLQSLGFTRASFSELDPGNDVHQDLTGQFIEVYCKHEVYEGKDKERWSLSRGGGEIKPLPSAEVRKLDSLFGRQLKALAKPVTGTAAEPPKQAVPQTVSADDIPF